MGDLGGQNRAVAAAALVFSKIDVLEEKWCQDACWDDLGSIWVAKRGRLGRPKGTQEASKTNPKRHQIFDRFLERFFWEKKIDLNNLGLTPTLWEALRNARGLAGLF